MHRVALTIALFTAGWMVMVSTPSMVQAWPPDEQTRVALAGGALTVETLGQLLKNMGYAPKAEGNLGYRLVFKDADWTYHISVSLSPDGNHLWLNFPLMPIQDPEKVPAAPLLRLMTENEFIGRARFSYHEDTKLFILNLPVENRDLSPVRVQAEIEGLRSIFKRTVDLWDTTKWAAVAARPAARILKGHADAVESVAFSPDARTLATGSVDSTVKLWDVATGRERATLRGHARSINSVAYSPDGQTLASASADGTVKLWTVATGREQATLTGHTNGKSWRWQPEVRGTCS